MKSELTLVVLAAGIGSRYGGLKQMDPVGPSGEFIIDYSIYDALRAGFSRVVFVIRRDIEAAFRSTIGERIGRHARTDYVFQELSVALPPGASVPAGRVKPWGTGHAILACAGAVTGPFAVINADDFYGRDSYGALAAFLGGIPPRGNAYCMVGFTLRNTLSAHGSVARGVCAVDGAGMLESIVERTRISLDGNTVASDPADLSGDEPVSMNMWGFTPSLFAHLAADFPAFLARAAGDASAEFFLPTVVDRLVKERAATVAVLRTGARWVGVTNPADRPAVVQHIAGRIAAGEYPPRLW